MQQQLNKPYLWSHSQIGASHIRKEKPNQDSVGILSLANDSVHILAVSDGHGSERYCRSDIGSKLAVKAARHVCEQFFDPLPTLSEAKLKLGSIWSHGKYYLLGEKKYKSIVSVFHSMKMKLPY